jgi:hypothetical protein
VRTTHLKHLFILAFAMISLNCTGRSEFRYQSFLSVVTPTPTPFSGKRVFQTSTTYNGNMGRLSGADALCAARASAAGLSGSWVPWLSDEGTDALSRITDVSPWYLVDGSAVAVSSLASLSNAASVITITKDEFGADVSGVSPVWTGTLTSALKSAAQTCNNWANSGTVMTGASGVNNGAAGTWVNNTNDACNQVRALYCFEQTAAPAAAAAPPVKRVFQTSTTYDGNIGGLAGADAACAARATAAGLTGNYVPWLGNENTSAISRVIDQSPWYLVDNTTQAVASYAALSNLHQ